MRLVEKLELKIEHTAEISELSAVMEEIEHKFSMGELTTQEHTYLISIKQKRLQTGLQEISLLSNLLDNKVDSEINSSKLDSCELLAEEFETMEREFSKKMLEIIKHI